MPDMTIYGVSISPFVRKVLLTCEYKGLCYKTEPVAPDNLPEQVAENSPLKKIPFIEIDGRWLADSSVICQYLESLHPEPAIYPSDPYDRAKTLWFEEYVDGGIIPRFGAPVFWHRVVYPLLFGQAGDESKIKEAMEQAAPPMLDYLDQQIGEREYLVADQYTLADMAAAGFLVNMQHSKIELDGDRWPNLLRYRDAHWRRPEFAKLIEQETHMLDAVAAKQGQSAS